MEKVHLKPGRVAAFGKASAPGENLDAFSQPRLPILKVIIFALKYNILF
jgi:hypothetical protein